MKQPIAAAVAGVGLLGGAAALGQTPHQVSVDPAARHQTIEGWGASMVGFRLDQTPYDDPRWRQAYRDLGLNILRLPMSKQVLRDESNDLNVPVELGSDLGENLAKMNFRATASLPVHADMAGWLHENALQPEHVKITGSLWTPPHWMKGPTGMEQYHVSNPDVRHPTPWLSDGGTQGDSIGGRLLVEDEHILEQYGRYIAAWTQGFEQEYGVALDVVSLQNESTFENPFDSMAFNKGADGDGAQHWQYAEALASVRDAFRMWDVQTQVKGPHVANLGDRPENPSPLFHQMGFINAVRDHEDPTLIDFLDYYNNNAYMPWHADAGRMWAAYWEGQDEVEGDWVAWANARGVSEDGKPIWVSEVSGERPGWRQTVAGSERGAMTVAQRMHNALVFGQASTYTYWQLSDHNNAETEFILLGKDNLDDPLQSGKYAAFKHFSRHIRPGAQRLAVGFDGGVSSIGGADEYDTVNGLSISGFFHEEDEALTFVVINMLDEAQDLVLDIPEAFDYSHMRLFLSDEVRRFEQMEDLLIQAGQLELTMPAYGIATLHIPEPGTLALTAAGLAVLMFRRRD